MDTFFQMLYRYKNIHYRKYAISKNIFLELEVLYSRLFPVIFASVVEFQASCTVISHIITLVFRSGEYIHHSWNFINVQPLDSHI